VLILMSYKLYLRGPVKDHRRIEELVRGFY
jgi:hypothetical protein